MWMKQQHPHCWTRRRFNWRGSMKSRDELEHNFGRRVCCVVFFSFARGESKQMQMSPAKFWSVDESRQPTWAMEWVQQMIASAKSKGHRNQFLLVIVDTFLLSRWIIARLVHEAHWPLCKRLQKKLIDLHSQCREDAAFVPTQCEEERFFAVRNYATLMTLSCCSEQ